LEVGTGFHPELTGRENIYLNGTILGMGKKEIDHKFNDIVDFAEISKFIDTPVKHYSSGMYVRLAFSVAAHMESEILLVDEVLAVGDVAFQKRCLGKMENVAREGRTVIFVSHNMATLQSLCTRGIVIHEGNMTFDGSIERAVRNYLANLTKNTTENLEENSERSGIGSVRFKTIQILNDLNQPTNHLIAGKPTSIEFTYENIDNSKQAQVAFTIYNHLGVAVTNFDTKVTNFEINDLGKEGKFICNIPNLPLPLGQYRIAGVIYVGKQVADHIPNLMVFEVSSSTFFENGRSPNIKYCSCMIMHEWNHKVRLSLETQ
jgi:lipopolysaccharide transport system ATP-binding protein